VLAAVLAKLAHFETSLQCLLIFVRKIIDLLALGALQFDHVVLTHRIIFIYFLDVVLLRIKLRRTLLPVQTKIPLI